MQQSKSFLTRTSNQLSMKTYFCGGLGDQGDDACKGGGALGKKGTTKEEEYFYHQQREQISELKKKLAGENSQIEEEIKRLQEAIDENRKDIEKIERLTKD
ncbi:hypothetical protein JTB14_002397 [Gonioctena quinquepunctata]|nr:hypothetical protein JTB14_002397 [Gonioctena quinquepunctata]